MGSELPTSETEFEAPDEITPEVLWDVRDALAFCRPVAPNTVYRCLGWAAGRIADLEQTLADIAERARKAADHR